MEKIFHSLCIILDSKVLQNFHLQMLVLGYQKQFQTLNRKQKCQISRKYLTTHIDTHTHRLTEPETLILIFFERLKMLLYYYYIMLSSHLSRSVLYKTREENSSGWRGLLCRVDLSSWRWFYNSMISLVFTKSSSPSLRSRLVWVLSFLCALKVS